MSNMNFLSNGCTWNSKAEPLGPRVATPAADAARAHAQLSFCAGVSRSDTPLTPITTRYLVSLHGNPSACASVASISGPIDVNPNPPAPTRTPRSRLDVDPHYKHQ